jgi:hypothetical protein
MTAKETADLTTKYEVLKKEVRMSNTQNTKDHQEIKDTLDTIQKDQKDFMKSIGAVLALKADQTDVDIVSNRLWWFVGIFVVAFLGVVGTLIGAHF